MAGGEAAAVLVGGTEAEGRSATLLILYWNSLVSGVKQDKLSCKFTSQAVKKGVFRNRRGVSNHHPRAAAPSPGFSSVLQPALNLIFTLEWSLNCRHRREIMSGVRGRESSGKEAANTFCRLHSGV